MKVRKLSVTEVNEYAQKVLSYDPILKNVTVEGEISNFVAHSSGHAYFSLKDSESKINCVMFSRYFREVKEKFKDGQKVQAAGEVSLFVRDGKFQLYVKSMKSAGLGKLYLKFEELKKKYQKLGYFSDLDKKNIPEYPEKIGIITSKEGAALQDILSVFNRRSSFANCFLYPVAVQGKYSKDSIVKAIEYFVNQMDVDLLILSRGGGSIEELWSFNEAEVIESIYACDIPVITGIGHETDFTLSDFVADLRTPTPSAAAEVALKSKHEINLELRNLRNALENVIQREIQNKRNILNTLSLTHVLKRKKEKLQTQKSTLDSYHMKMNSIMDKMINKKRNILEQSIIKINQNNPINIMEKGYSILYNKDKEVIKDADQVRMQEKLVAVLKKGQLEVCVIDKIDGD